MIPWTPLAKNMVILKITDGGSGHLENCNISALDRLVLKKFGMVMCLVPPT